MKKGSTPTHHFTLPFSCEWAKEVEITYAQNGNEILKKYLQDCTLEENTISTTLSQQETFEFDADFPVQIQIRVLDENDGCHVSNIFSVNCDECLSNEVL